jgi:hypothetical protein
LTSPTPYDPPLTYGGWIQSRALGARIASLLRSREIDNGAQSAGNNTEKHGGGGRRRRHRVIIHSSPFLRCVQTSIAISSGLAQNPGQPHRSRPLSSHSVRSSSFYSSPRLRPTLEIDSPKLAAIPEPSSPSKAGNKAEDVPQNIKKATLRVDAFLGEWLTPDYFELITPPPGSVMMVAGAKADLLRREDYSGLIQVRDTPSTTTFQGFPGGWGSPVVAAVSDQEDAPLPSLSSLTQTLPRRDRTSSLGSAGSSGSRHSGKILSKMSTANPAEHGIYQPPVPSYAISNAEAIPAGYVAHARDACVTVDYQWDSMRDPQNWGTGGEYGEEWSSMHKRFRKGLQQLIHYYEDQDSSSKLGTKLSANSEDNANDDCAIQDDEDADLVVILVTHGAGCNALIGALTNQPVLLDVGMASLTMAVRKTSPTSTPASSPDTTKSHSRQASRSVTISEEYEVKLVANTEHLRPSTNSTPTSSRTPSLAGIPISRQFGGPNGNTSFVDTDRSRSVGTTSSNFGSIRRAASAVATPLSQTYTPGKATSIGLWTPKPADEEAIEEPGDDMVLNFGDDGAREPPKPEQPKAAEQQTENDNVSPLGGLWGGAKPTGEAEIVREIAPKRRWTVNEPGIA